MKPKQILKRLSPFGKQKNGFWKDHHRCYEELDKKHHAVQNNSKPHLVEVDTDLDSSSTSSHQVHETDFLFSSHDMAQPTNVKDSAFPSSYTLSPPREKPREACSPPRSPPRRRYRQPLNDFEHSPLDATFTIWEDTAVCFEDLPPSPKSGLTWPPIQDDVAESSMEPFAVWGDAFVPSLEQPTPPTPALPLLKDSTCNEISDTMEPSSATIDRPAQQEACAANLTLATPINSRNSREKRTKISVLLLKPSSKNFELTQIQYRPSSSSVEVLLNMSKERASDIRLVTQKYTGLYHSDHEVDVTDNNLEQIQDHDVLVAVPVGYTSKQVSRIAKSILSTRSMTDLVHRMSPARPPLKEVATTVDTTVATVLEREKRVKLLVLLLDPRFRTFELCEIKYRPSTGSVQKVLNKIPRKATRHELGYRTYTGLCRPSTGTLITDSCLSNGDLDVVVAIPKKSTGEIIARHARQILSSRNLTEVVEQHKLNQESFDQEPLVVKDKCSPPRSPESEKRLVSPRSLMGVPLINSRLMSTSLSSFEDESLPSVVCSAMSTASSSDMSYCISSNEHQVVVCTPPPPPLAVSPKNLYSVPSLRRRTRRAQCKSFALRVSGTIVASMVFVYRADSALGGMGSQVVKGVSGVLQVVLFVFFMILVQRGIEDGKTQTQKVIKPQKSGIPQTVMVAH